MADADAECSELRPAYRVKRGAYRGTSSPLPDWLGDGTLLRRINLRREEWVDFADFAWVSSIGVYVVVGGEHDGTVVALCHSNLGIDSRHDPRPVVEAHPDLERPDEIPDAEKREPTEPACSRGLSATTGSGHPAIQDG